MPVVRPVEAMEEELLAGSCKDFLSESEDRAGDGFSVVATYEAAGRLLAGGGDRKEEGLVSPEDGAKRGVEVPTLLLLCKSRPCNSFSASIAK